MHHRICVKLKKLLNWNNCALRFISKFYIIIFWQLSGECQNNGGRCQTWRGSNSGQRGGLGTNVVRDNVARLTRQHNSACFHIGCQLTTNKDCILETKCIELYKEIRNILYSKDNTRMQDTVQQGLTFKAIQTYSIEKTTICR